MCSKIVNPKTGRLVKITTKLGKQILNNYAAQNGGGFVDCADGRGAGEKCRNLDIKNGCVYIKATDLKSTGVSKYGCYGEEQVKHSLLI